MHVHGLTLFTVSQKDSSTVLDAYIELMSELVTVVDLVGSCFLLGFGLRLNLCSDKQSSRENACMLDVSRKAFLHIDDVTSGPYIRQHQDTALLVGFRPNVFVYVVNVGIRGWVCAARVIIYLLHAILAVW